MECCRNCVVFLDSMFHLFEKRPFGLTSGLGIPKALGLEERRRLKWSQAQGCRLCRMISAFLERHYGPEYDGLDAVNHSVITWYPFESQLESDKGRVSSMELRSDNFYKGALHFSVWADEELGSSIGLKKSESPSDALVTWPPILYGSPAETSSLVRRLLNNCLDHHDTCKVAQEQEEVELPSRLLLIKNESGVISVNLCESKGLKGRYCALSHCWGPKDKQPLKTTNDNIKDHLACIIWDHVPSTFRDAIILVQSLGIEYLWIDSLCIIQDDEKDWENEAKMMASVYRQATLVIAAADSKDSTEGLYTAQRPDALTFRCPFTMKKSPVRSVYHIAVGMGNLRRSGYEMEEPLRGPLKQRAWAYQEWYLGRREIFFTSEGLKWRCKQGSMNERGNWVDLSMLEAPSWTSCLAEYSGKYLTYPTDRITALLGIVTELQKTRYGSFVARLGVWENDLAAQLLWRPREAIRTDFPGLPSWSWASTQGRKTWFSFFDEESISVVSDVNQTVSLTKSTSLNASGLLIKAAIPSSPIPRCCIDYFGYRADILTEGNFLPGWGMAAEHSTLERFLIYAVDAPRSIIGMATFDDIPFLECFCFILNSSERDKQDQCSPDYEGDSLTEIEEYMSDSEKITIGDVQVEDRTTKGVKDNNIDYKHEDTDECVNIFEIGRCPTVYWALLLNPVDGTLKKFRRVGAAILWSRALETTGSEVTDFEII